MAAQVKSTLKEGGVRKPRIFCSRECTTRVGRRAAQGEVAKTVKLCVAVGARDGPAARFSGRLNTVGFKERRG